MSHSFIHSSIALVKIGRSVGESRVACAWRVGVDVVVGGLAVCFFTRRARGWYGDEARGW